jgi:sarcosine oxidase subunit delta
MNRPPPPWRIEMLLIACPHCEMERPEIEFRYGGEALIERPASSASDSAWTDYLFMRRNEKGPHAERWRHTHGCGRFFLCLRDTRNDRIVATWRIGEAPPRGAGAG